MSERDPFVRGLERDALIACGCCAIGALALASEGLRAAAAVLGGGLLAGVSYNAIKSAAGATVDTRSRAAALVKFVTRHAILAVAAYVMLVRFRLHPIGILVGASSLVAAAAAATVRSFRRSS